MNVKFFKFACTAIIGLLLLGGCNNIDNGLVTSVHMRDKFNQTTDTFTSGSDENITMTLSIKNDSTSDKTLNFSDAQIYDFIIKDSSNNIIWQWSAGLAFAAVTTSFTLGPTDIRTITYIWNQQIDATPTYIPSGSYTLEAKFIGYTAATTTLIIK